MELTQQVSTLQDEVKLLKGEIAAVLKELRTALLNQDNPFAIEAPPPFRPVRSEGSETTQSGGVETPDWAERELAAEGLSAPPDTVPSEQAPTGEGVEPESIARPTPLPVAPAPAGPTPQAAVSPQEPSPAPRRWTVLTVASLASWTEDALGALGPQRFQIVLELASFAGLLPADVRDALKTIAQAMPESGGEEQERTMNVNTCLVLLRQLEAILEGEEELEQRPKKLVRKRAGRHSRVR